MDASKQIRDLLAQAEELAYLEVIRLAKKVIISNNLGGFFMSKGRYFFTDKDGHPIPITPFEFTLFMGQWDKVLKITSSPLRLDQNGQIIND